MDELIDILRELAYDPTIHGMIENAENVDSCPEIYSEYYEKLICVYKIIQRHMYSTISEFLRNELTIDAIDQLVFAVKNIIEWAKINYIAQNNEEKEYYQNIIKLYDHLCLDASRITAEKHMEEIQINTENLNKSICNTAENAKAVLNKADNKISDLSGNLISILGIFAGIVVTFTVAGTITGTALTSLNESSIKYLILAVIVLGWVFFNIITFLMTIVAKLSGHDVSWKYCIPIVLINAAFIIFGVLIWNQLFPI